MMKGFLLTVLSIPCLFGAGGAEPPRPPAPAKGERIVLLGNGLAERMFTHDHFEAELHLRFPDHELVVRNMGRQGDTAGFRPHPARKSQWAFPGAEAFHPDLRDHHGIGFFPSPDEWLAQLKADTIVAFFGSNESFAGPAGVEAFEAEIDAFTRHTLNQKYNGTNPPRLVLVSPIAFEDLTATRDLPDGRKENENLRLYTEAMRRVAERHGLGFIDAFSATAKMYADETVALTINGFALNDEGYSRLAPVLADGLYLNASRVSKADPKRVLAGVKEKNWCWFNDYNILNGVHAYGQRYEPYGPQNYPDEIAKLREMTALREARVHALARGATTSLVVDDSSTRPLPTPPTNFNRPIEYLGREKAIESFTLAPGFKIELFASETEFPNLKNPVQMSFDNKGRLWVAVSPTYPHWKPGDPMPDDKLLIYEDTDGDGRADLEKVFADGLQLPIGFEIAPEGVYVSQEPNLCLLVDHDGDDRADRVDVVLGGFDTHDTHHAISAYAADAAGAFYMCEGRFLHSQVETPYGPERVNDGGVWRYDPRKARLERYSQSDYNNPWGIAFDDWDQCFISDASGGNNWWGLPLSAKMPYGVEVDKVEEFAPKRARPTSGSEFISSRHFPDEYQGRFILNNSIGFLGTSMWEIREEGAGYVGEQAGDLLSSTDPNFRPVDCEFAPDGSLYIVDWHNALIGHMQHNARDPKRDRDHGRIYRVTYPARPLVKPPVIAGAPIPALLDALKEPEYRTRYRARRELRGRPAEEVLPAVRTWVASLDAADPRYERWLCEALWVTWSQNWVDADLLRSCLRAKAHQARAAAVHVLRYAHRDVPGSFGLLEAAAATDPHPRVRLEAIVAASWIGGRDGARIALAGLHQPLDRWMVPVTRQILEHTLREEIEELRAQGGAALFANLGASTYLQGSFQFAPGAVPADQKSYGPTRRLSEEEMKVYDLGKAVYHRDAHCATCHQPNGKGLPSIYPRLENSQWVTKDDDRLIKIILKGLWGPIEVNGQTFDPAKGVPPMTGFAGLLTDEEVAAVIAYVRNSFGNTAPFVAPEKVRAVREATRERANFYMVDELLKEHPLE
jgi:mono/diheme cytochrome c family protein/glucose/arabinose dehydrogenase